MDEKSLKRIEQLKEVKHTARLGGGEKKIEVQHKNNNI